MGALLTTMEHHHDTHDKGGGIWSLFNTLFAIAFGGFTVLAGGALIYGGIKYSRANPAPAEAPAEVATAAAAPAGAPAPPAPGTAPVVTAATSTAAPAAAPSGDSVSFTLKPGTANPMSFDITSLLVKSGQKVSITFSNVGAVPLQHNFVLCKAGSKERIIAIANSMMSDMAKWMPLGYVPDSPDVIAHTKLLNLNESGTVEFTAPAEKGDYPYLCTFPGHAMIMNGVMKVE